MTKGSCACGSLTWEFQGEPAAKVACHCIPCRKTSGTTNSYNLMVPTDKFNVLSGSLRHWKRKGDSGKEVTYNYCSECPTVIYVQADAMPGANILKMGTVDDASTFDNLGYPGLEIFTKNRPGWCKAIPGADQKETS